VEDKLEGEDSEGKSGNGLCREDAGGRSGCTAGTIIQSMETSQITYGQ